ncbi:hypothetical protein Y032_0075g914 [Ancylostoma ceylanicum]|uniref:Uncharacterized protein n=1 Tax=Ancylostoma ceylanicum TaxID=53326 RepID=A0A016TTW2_9BILA|nr:hypothetical protein Y032_0075g914 [Ancylostoma ceylanicum]
MAPLPGLGFTKRYPSQPVTVSVTGYRIDYVVIGNAGSENWFASLVSFGYMLIHGRSSKRNQVSKPSFTSCVSQHYVTYGITNHANHRRFA